MMFETSLTTAKLDGALAKAQGEIEAASKDKVNPAFRSKYADLTAVWTAIRPSLSKHLIAVTQWPMHSDDNKLHIVTRLAHDGEWIKCEFSVPLDKSTAHGYGSAVTYAKRFSLAAAVGVVADDDDDGNAASKHTNGNGHHEITGNANVKGYKPPASSTSAAANAARDAAAYWTQIERQLGVIKAESDLDDWIAANKDEVNARLAKTYVPTLKDKIHEMREEFALAGAPA